MTFVKHSSIHYWEDNWQLCFRTAGNVVQRVTAAVAFVWPTSHSLLSIYSMIVFLFFFFSHSWYFYQITSFSQPVLGNQRLGPQRRGRMTPSNFFEDFSSKARLFSAEYSRLHSHDSLAFPFILVFIEPCPACYQTLFSLTFWVTGLHRRRALILTSDTRQLSD